jgi:hypothetical protein
MLPRWPLALLALAAVVGASCQKRGGTSSPPTLNGHAVRVDPTRKLLSWSTESAPYAHVSRLAWEAMKTKFPVQPNGLRTYLAYSRFDPESFEGISWPHNPAGLYAMLADSAALWYAYSGDRDVVAVVEEALDWQLSHGTTPGAWEWASVPYASANAGDVDYRGADDEWCDFCGRGDGVGVIEPDKVGELGYAYLQLFELTGDEHYRDAAVACSDALARHVRQGDESRSPWPFRVYAKSGIVREEYSANVIGPVMLFDELVRLGIGDVASWRRARDEAWDWMLRVPVKNDAWTGYFEDISIQTDPAANPNQYSPLRTARYLLLHPSLDPDWRDHVSHILAWTARTFGDDTETERGMQWSAQVISEQAADMAKMASHTARWASVNALWFEATGDLGAKERAARSFNWATYMCDRDGVVAVGEDKNEGFWFSDGYGDYVRQFLTGMGAVPEWAPASENHVVRSTSIVKRILYEPNVVTYATFDRAATDVLRLASRPESITVGGNAIAESAKPVGDGEDGYTVHAAASGGAVVRVTHASSSEVVVTTSIASQPAPPADPAPPAVEPTPSGCTSSGRAESDAAALALALATAGSIALALHKRRKT